MPDIINSAPPSATLPHGWEGPPVSVRLTYADGSPPRMTTQRNRRVADYFVEAINGQKDREWWETPTRAEIVGGEVMVLDFYEGM